MKNKKTIIISISTISVILISVIAYILIGKSDNKLNNPSKLIVSNYKDGEITLKEAQIELNKLSLKNDKLLGIAFDNLSADQKEFVIKEAILKEIAYKEAKKRKLNKTTGRKTGIIELASNDGNLSEEQNLNNLLNSNSVNVAGNISNQTVKEDIDFINSDFEGTLSVPVDLLANPDKVKDAFANFGKNIRTVGNHLSDTASNAYEAVTNNTGNKSTIDTFIGKQRAQVLNIAASRNNRARDTIKNADRGQSPENLEYAVNVGANDKDQVRIYSNESDGAAGMYDQKNSQAYVNAANVALDENNLIFTTSHERAHANGGNEDYANMIAQGSVSDWNKYSKINSGYQQTGYNASDYGIRTENNSSYKPTGAQYNQAYNARNNLLFNKNTNSANLVAASSRDNLPVDTLLDLAQVGYDATKIAYGKITKDQELVKEGLQDLAADSAALAIPYVPAGATKVKRLLTGSKSVDNAQSVVSGSKGVVKSGVGNNSPNDITNVTNVDKPKVDFYVKPDGEAVPGTGYRAIIDDKAVERAQNGNPMSRGDTYITFDDISNMNPSQVKDKLQLSKEPSHYIEFNTLDHVDSISIPKENWNRGQNLEPITKSFPEFGSGGATQVITNKPINNYIIKELPKK